MHLLAIFLVGLVFGLIVLGLIVLSLMENID